MISKKSKTNWLFLAIFLTITIIAFPIFLESFLQLSLPSAQRDFIFLTWAPSFGVLKFILVGNLWMSLVYFYPLWKLAQTINPPILHGYDLSILTSMLAYHSIIIAVLYWLALQIKATFQKIKKIHFKP